MRSLKLILLLFVVVFCGLEDGVGQTSPTPENAPKNAPQVVDNKDERYRIGYQDSLEIQVFRHPELSQKVNVNPDGTIYLFRAAKPIAAVCKTERELADTIAKEYLSFLKKPEVNVYATEKRSQSFGVIGAVEKPGTYFINRRTRLIELLAFAGGPSREAGSRLIVARTGSSSACQQVEDEVIKEDVILLNYRVKDVLENKENLWMKPGDIVSVLDSDVIYIYGNVKKEGQIKVKEPITLTQAIATAEGFKPSTQKDKIRVLRQKQGSADREELIFDLNEITKRKIADPFLQPNDIVAVSEDTTKAIFRKIGNSLSNGVGGLFYTIP